MKEKEKRRNYKKKANKTDAFGASVLSAFMLTKSSLLLFDTQ